MLKRDGSLPNCVMCRIHIDNVRGELEHSFGFLVPGHDGSEVGHGLAIVVRVCDGGEGVRTAVILGYRDNVGPFF